MNKLPSFCTVLREMRIRAKLTQKELADLAGLSVRAIRDLERGRVSRPRKDTVRLLADAFRLGTDRRNAFMATAAGPLVDHAHYVMDALPADDRPLDSEIHTLAELLVLEKRRLMSVQAEQPVSGEEIVFVATGSTGIPTAWSVLCLPTGPGPQDSFAETAHTPGGQR
ncbi:helix-turn-helix domain-containing protein [Streptomyces sp. NPDC018833]|uniref:helix-turn-helix domain-containing protein n=1 Tax=Streptomyces sp. NPDC018833 TaxID=3365053 RepID=UPI00378FDACE